MTKEKQQRVLLSVKRAEKRTSSEFVTVVLESSRSYEEAMWRGGVLMGGIFATLYFIVHYLGIFSMLVNPLWNFLFFISAMIMGMLLVVLCPPMKRLMVGKRSLSKSVRKKTRQLFLEKEVFLTRDRTGILILISLFEKRIEILADSGINARVSRTDWDRLLQQLTIMIHDGRIADALIEAVESCTQLLLKAGFVVKPHDVNELPDEITYGGES